MTSKFENLLIKLGKQRWAQHLRRTQLSANDTSTAWAKDIITMDTRLRELSQRLLYIREEHKALLESDDLEAEEQLQVIQWQTELEDLARRYWHLEREFYRREASCPEGPLRRAYVTWKGNPEWYMSRYLRDDCAGRGGCCGRACGCCGRPRDAEGRVRLGHCTIECGCCRRVRGFDLTAEDKVRYQKLFDCGLKENEVLSDAMVLAYVFGLEG
ncbi:hypothetical protein BDV25DRAFT_169679 [Aspergillus avenaceus]|uniref:Uncharacterized protein n=1 Tax=Aspergillus avenaceus TaxID=36643 RepID=A0A5N6TJY7_ASPAV|nr:hypothetical protein BDV25DRAFT_169679 [Aspergillus avenaceus]